MISPVYKTVEIMKYSKIVCIFSKKSIENRALVFYNSK